MFSLPQVNPPLLAGPAFALPLGGPAPPGHRHQCQTSTRRLFKGQDRVACRSPGTCYLGGSVTCW